jgi:imidazolonepropionase-like amidohydrolase
VEVREDWQASVDRLGNQVEIDLTFAEWSLFLTGRMKKLGVSIGAGTDTPIGLAVPGYSLHSELEMLVLAGLTPLQAIESATVQPAIYFSLLDKSGSIDVGKQADMILLDADPLADIANTKKISLVVSKGIAFTQSALVDRLAASNN